MSKQPAMPKLTPEGAAEVMQMTRKLQDHLRVNRLLTYKPYAYQREVHRARDAAGDWAYERLLMAGNQVGKTLSGAAESAFHATGEYPDWWVGFRFEKPTMIWVGGQNNDKVRDIAQKQLLGDPHDDGAAGTGWIPRDRIGKRVRKPGIPDALESVLVRHKSGHNVTVKFKSYDAGKADWMGEPVDFTWLDEEPPPDIYSQALARGIKTRGAILMTFTPENGATGVVLSFMNNLLPGQALYRAGWDDAPHLDGADKDRLWAAIPPHEREMRKYGHPVLGSGLVYPVPDDVFTVEPFKVPAHWSRLAAMDFGWDHPTAIVWLAYDRENDLVYLYDAHKARNQTPPYHAAAIKGRGEWIPMAWPRDALQSRDGNNLAMQYRKLGVNMLAQPFENQGGGHAVEPGIMEVLTRLQTGRLKVFSHLHEWFEEKRTYHRIEGKLAKTGDDLMDATRYAVMSLRHANVLTFDPRPSTYGRDYDPFTRQAGHDPLFAGG